MQTANIKVCICGGGNIGHSLVAAFGRYGDVDVLTRRPEEWSEHLRFQIADGVCEETKGHVIASSDASIISEATVIVVALPRFAIKQELAKIEPFLHSGQTLVFVPAPAGMEDIVNRMLFKGIEVVGFQRVPYVARIKEYGKFVWMSDVRPVCKLALSNPERKEYWRNFFRNTIGSEVSYLSSFLSFTFSNSNPLLHPSRLVELLHNKDGYIECPYFYADWGDEASKLYVAADNEMRVVFAAYASKVVETDYESGLEHYGVHSPTELTQKIRSIKSLQLILAPWKQDESGMWVPDFTSRYFTEDVPYGTKVIQRYSKEVNIKTPVIDMLIAEVGKF